MTTIVKYLQKIEYITKFSCTFTITMGKYIIGILMCVAFIPYLGGFRGDVIQKSFSEVSVTERSANTGNELCETIGTKDYFLLDEFSLNICDIIISMSNATRGGNVSRTLKFASTLQLLSSLNTLGIERESKNLNFQHRFVKTSYEYFIYTIKRLLI